MSTWRWLGCIVIAFLAYWVFFGSVGPGWQFINIVPLTGVCLALVMPAAGGFVVTLAAAMLAPSNKVLVSSVMVPIVSFAPFAPRWSPCPSATIPVRERSSRFYGN